MFVFHALRMDKNGDSGLWLKAVSWRNDWPVLD